VLALWGALKVSVTASFRGVGVSELTTAATGVSSSLGAIVSDGAHCELIVSFESSSDARLSSRSLCLPELIT
jgi:hypothetical protein